MVQCIEGSGSVVIEGVDSRLEEGEIILIPSMAEHSVYTEKGFKILLNIIK